VGLRIGTRGSRLALAQAGEVAALLEAAGHRTEIVPISTAGDRGASPKDSPSGIKGLFVAEITESLVRGEVDLAVHSAKDLPSEDPEGVVVAAVPQRGLPYDVLVTRQAELSHGASVGTSSLRRRAQFLRMHPDARLRDLRGNVDTRLRKLADGVIEGLVLAAAGLARLGQDPQHAAPIPVEDMVPAPGQGALAIQARSGDPAQEAAGLLDHPASRDAFESERGVVSRLGGGCRLPLGAYAERRDGGVRLLAVVVRPDGSDLLWSQVDASSPEDAAGEAAEILLSEGAARILEDARR
jgi:hydroxymethylbilane synthase